ncbi:hypothetical protein [Streptomyces sp. NPDC053560]|uniref:hypothetical protein n=1 Tax=Streptomyces sp. NPDC053560 TaxID=3365711 RepID=UPI0037D8A2A3
MTSDQDRARAVVFLTVRLVRRHDLTAEEAVTAIAQVRAGQDGPHTQLVREEATAVMREAAIPIRRLLDALRPVAVAAARAFADIARALRPIQAAAARTARAARRDRPDWASPYGPPPRRGGRGNARTATRARTSRRRPQHHRREPRRDS